MKLGAFLVEILPLLAFFIGYQYMGLIAAAMLSVELARANPNGCVATLHPGTVDTNLPKPFQGGVPAGKLFTANHAAGCLWQVLDRLGPGDTGQLHAWDGSVIPY